MRYSDKKNKSERTDQQVSHTSGGSPSPASATPASTERRRPFRRLRLRQRVVPLLVALVLLSSCGIVALAYLGARANAIASAQSRAMDDVRVERQMLADQGANLVNHDGQLFVGVDNAAIVLNDDTGIVDRTRSLINGYATIYQLEGTSLVAISTNLPTGTTASAHDSRALGDTLSGPAFHALLGQCGATDTADCHHAYSGVVTTHGVWYAAAYEPLTDASGAFVGALSVAIPLDSVLGPTVQFAVMLLLVALLMAFIAISAGSWIVGSISDHALGALDRQLDVVADATIDLDHLARAQVERAARQSRAARQVSDEVRALNALASSMNEAQSELRESAGEIWGEMSQPGAAPDPAVTLRWARQAAVASGRIGSAAEHTRDLCQHIVTLMNHIIAEGNVVSQRGQEMQVCAQELRGSVEQVEMTLGERLINRQRGLATIPLLRRIQPASRRLRRAFTAHTPRLPHTRHAAQSAADTPPNAPQASTPPDAGSTGDSIGVVKPHGLTGQQPRIPRTQPPHPGSHLNHMGRTSQHPTADAGEWRRASGSPAQAPQNAQPHIPQPSHPLGRGEHTGQPPRSSSHQPPSPRHPRNGNETGLPDLPENSSSWRWINPNENRWADTEE